MMVSRRVEVLHTQLHMVLTLALDGGKWFASWPSCFTLSTDWMGSRSELTLEVVWILWRQEKTLPCHILMSDSMIIQPQNCLLVKRAFVQQVPKLPTLHREWILTFQAPSARLIPSATSHLMQSDVNIFPVSLDPQLVSSIEPWTIICVLLSVPCSSLSYNA